MNKKRFINFTCIALFVLLVSNLSFAKNTWDKAFDSTQHSFRDLGNDYYVPLKMRRLSGAKLVLFNYEAAQKLGLSVPEDPKELEKIILDRFSVFVDNKNPASDVEMFATRYQDSGSKKAGEALGDGRAAWAGELSVLSERGTKRNVDVVLKGIGQTPLAWTNHSDPGHSDGLQSMNEAVHSFIMSEINAKNQLDTSIDLAVIEIPLTKEDKHTGKTSKAAITVRVGGQTRIAHYRYFSDNQSQFERIFEYIIKRDLGLPQNTKVDKKLVDDYLTMFVKNISEEAARYYDLHAVHASPTPGNRTTLGSTIDMGTFRYLDGHHQNYRYLFDKLKLEGQTNQLRSYIHQIFKYMENAQYRLTPGKEERESFFSMYNKTFESTVEKIWLLRLGLSDNEIEKLSSISKKNFTTLVRELYELSGSQESSFGRRKFVPAGLDVRKILGSTMEVISGQDSSKDLAWLFKNERGWATLGSNETTDLAKRYRNSVQNILYELPGNKIKKRWIKNASLMTKQNRFENGRGFFDSYEKPILKMLEDNKSTFVDMTSKSHEGIESLVDMGLPTREINNVGRKPRIGVFSGTFDPPHITHVNLVKAIKKAHNLDIVYIVPNLTSDHKQNITPYKHRKAMTKIAFGGIDGVKLSDSELEFAFKSGDMTGVVETLNDRHQNSTLFQIMGNDSYIRYKKAAEKDLISKLNNISLIVSGRESQMPADKLLGNKPVIPFNGDLGADSSSKVRQMLKENKKSPSISNDVWKYINTNGLYNVAGNDNTNCANIVRGFLAVGQ
ncbi:MAG: YdiU family protein [Bacteriovoracaceae bacterium]|nr:YdiU family protein [Bacteriovoracaceae bacterium]